MALVFQYGSNCSESQVNNPERLCDDARFVGTAETVEDFELAFVVFSTKSGCAASDIVRKPGGKVWGVLYEVPNYLLSRESARTHGRRSFDAVEGEGTNYKREIIELRRPDGQLASALTYTVRHPQSGLTTTVDYVCHVITGLRERGVPDEYIALVKALATANNPDIAAQVQTL